MNAEKPASLGGIIALQIWRAVRWILAGIFSVALFLMSASAFGTGQKIVAFGIGALWIIRWCAILVHEGGHAIAATLVGWRTIIFAVKPLSVNLLNGRFAHAQRADGGDVGGWVTAVPRNPAAVTKSRYAWFVLGGPIANAVLAIAAFWSASTWLPAYDRPDLMVSTLGGATGFVSAFLAVFNLFPSVRAGVSSDGDLLRWIWRADAGWRPAVVLGSLNALICNDARPRNRPRWMLDELRSSDHEDAARAADAMDISAALDAPPVDAAQTRAMIDAFHAHYGDNEWLASCDAYLAAVWEDDVAYARTRRWNGETTDDQLPLRLAVDAAIAARGGDRDAAEDLLRRMRVAARAAPWMRPVFRDIDQQIGALLDNAIARPAAMLPKSLTSPPIAP